MSNEQPDEQPIVHDVPSPAREKWLINTLYALRGHFNKNRPALPEDMQRAKSASESIVVHCMDRLLDEKDEQRIPRGRAFDVDLIGGAAPPERLHLNPRLKAELSAVYGALTKAHTPYPKNIVILGHEGCLADKALHAGILDRASEHDDSVLQWMLPMASEELKKAIIAAKERNADDTQVQNILEKAVVLQSMENMHNEWFTHKKQVHHVGNLINDGVFNIIGAIRGDTPDKDGRFPLSVYDPEAKQFRPIEELYREAFPGAQYFLFSKIEARKAALDKGNTVPTATVQEPVVVSQGAVTRTVHTFNIPEIREGLRVAIKAMHGAHL